MLNPSPDHTASPALLPISTGSLRLDLALRTGGVLPGDVFEISGPPESGKTTLCLHIAAAATRLGRVCIWLDADGLLDPRRALRFGADAQRMLIIPPLKAAPAVDILTRLANCGEPALIVIDSLAGLLDEDLAQPDGAHSLERTPSAEQLLSLVLRRVSPQLKLARLSLVFTRRSLPSTGPAYHQLASHLSRLAPPLHTSARIALGEPSKLYSGKQVAGQRVPARVQRLALISSNPRTGLSIRKKIAPCCGEIELDIMYNQGIIRIGEVFDLSLQLGLIEYREGTFIGEHRELGPDRAAAIAALERFGLAAQLEQVLRRKLLRNEHLDG